jgi:hypothetical protein
MKLYKTIRQKNEFLSEIQLEFNMSPHPKHVKTFLKWAKYRLKRNHISDHKIKFKRNITFSNRKRDYPSTIIFAGLYKPKQKEIILSNQLCVLDDLKDIFIHELAHILTNNENYYDKDGKFHCHHKKWFQKTKKLGYKNTYSTCKVGCSCGTEIVPFQHNLRRNPCRKCGEEREIINRTINNSYISSLEN